MDWINKKWSSRDIHIRNIMLFMFRRNLKAAKATKKINKVYNNALNLRTCQRWFECFSDGRINLDDNEKSGAPRMDIDKDLLILVEENSRYSSRDLAILFGVSHNAICEHLVAIGKSYRSGEWVPHELTNQQMANRVWICDHLLKRLKNEPFLERIVTGDEKWCLYVNVTKKRQWLSVGQQPIPTAKPGNFQKR